MKPLGSEVGQPDEAKRRDRAALGWFSLGTLLGAAIAVGVILFTGMAGRPNGALANPSASQSLDVEAIREAARQGALEGANTAIVAESTRSAIELAQSEKTQDTAQPQAQLPRPAGPEKPPTQYPVRDANARGSVTAPITMIEYGDFGCVYCENFHQNTLQAVLDNYVATGKVRLVYKQMPIVSLHPGADLAAVGSECAADQGKFWDYHDVLFARNDAPFTNEMLIAWAGELKLDTAKFTACLTDGAAAQRVEADMNEAQQVGVRGTPSFLINGQLFVGAQPYQNFVAKLDELLGAQ